MGCVPITSEWINTYFIFFHATFKRLKVVTFKCPHHVVNVLVPYDAFSFFSSPSQMTSIPLSEGMARTLTPTTIFVLLFHLTLMRTMGAKIVLTPTAGVVATNEFHILIGKTSMAIITIYIALFHTSNSSQHTLVRLRILKVPSDSHEQVIKLEWGKRSLGCQAINWRIKAASFKRQKPQGDLGIQFCFVP